MVFPIAGGNESKGYEISNSLRFNDGDSPILTRTPSSAGDGQKFTYSTWFKRSILGAEMHPFLNAGSNASNYFRLNLSSGDAISSFSISGGSTDFEYVTTQLFRDPSAWYHLVFAVDTTNGTAANRVRFYINGSEVTSFSTESNPSQNLTTDVNGTTAHYIGRRTPGNDSFYDGYLTETHLVDGSQLAPTSFGEFDDNGVWIPKKYSGTYGTNGFFLEFQQTGTGTDASGIGADTSGQDNHFAPTNLAATDITEDTCTNNFCTLNSIDGSLGSATLADGNTDFTGANGSAGRSISTIGVTQGKWYAEFKIKNTHKSRIGIIDEIGYARNNADNDGVDYDTPNGIIYTYLNGTDNDTGDNSSSSGVDVTNPSADDILGVALDADNEKVRFFLNGSALTSDGDGFTPLQRTGQGLFKFFHVRDGSGSGDDEPNIICNFGNPPYAVSSSNTDGKYGNFEYAPPSGFYALCTKRLAEFG